MDCTWVEDTFEIVIAEAAGKMLFWRCSHRWEVNFKIYIKDWNFKLTCLII
jgi:hypothetical protein